jgi:hypothetical protein
MLTSANHGVPKALFSHNLIKEGLNTVCGKFEVCTTKNQDFREGGSNAPPPSGCIPSKKPGLGRVKSIFFRNDEYQVW